LTRNSCLRRCGHGILQPYSNGYEAGSRSGWTKGGKRKNDPQGAFSIGYGRPENVYILADEELLLEMQANPHPGAAR
jgi:hypothetical protein